ncbi:hypothetical protein EJ04DRAFT_424952 [Polyplosphaeria fusca]|uniref:Arrestin C-terminal-like domain-containing protein n=1 Tax=Polyplosphaeria fusca TaxID=682080 RepID=A0A9P4RAV5_9PLEO|nr:hypothetical protein EJ04DRAFT_424952 [Polyplosphaeria fusca]
MTSSPGRGSTASTSSSRSLLSRLRLPLHSKTRNFTDFDIQPDDPHRQYSPGDIISGAVVVKVIKPLRITHLVISLHGYAQVFKNPNTPGDAYKSYATTVGSGKGKKNGSYFGNGFASLFEDEAVLCGEGRLGEGVYHFNFELEFPSKGLPSSIEFERGTVSYMLTATLTRPTTISPTTSTHTKVSLLDVLDIAPIAEPKPRVISLEPISRRARARAVRKRPSTSDTVQGSENADPTKNGRVSELSSVAEESDTPGSPAPSDTSFESRVSSGAGSGTDYGIRSVRTATDGPPSVSGSQAAFRGKTITATINVLKGGLLRGDQIPVKISINHTKHVRSLKGIIITLYRQARVDMHPALPVAANSKGDKTKSEDYYPKSRTGLGGLSLSSAGSSHLFRKDLSQSFAPLFVDPRTLNAEVKTAVRVPEEAFPTISNVPGAMISFRYFVEVVVDIQGKLTGLDRMFPNAGLVSLGNAPGMGGTSDATGGMFSTWGGNFADTDAIRREKGVISCVFEVIIGTKDSERNGKRRQQTQDVSAEAQSEVHEFTLGPGEEPGQNGVAVQDSYYNYDENGQYYDSYGYGYDGYYDNPAYEETQGVPHPPYVAPPNPEPEEGLSEKERMRRAEARLLPSQPPGADPSGPSSPSLPRGIPPSAPVLPEEEDPRPPYFPPESSASTSTWQPPSFSAAASSSRAPTPGQAPDDDRTTTTGSSLTVHATTRPRLSPQGAGAGAPNPVPDDPSSSPAPDYFPSSAAHVRPTDDKQELQRRRLEMERSAPPDEGEDSPEPSAPPASSAQNTSIAPSAPVLDEEDEGLVGPVRPSGSNEETGRRDDDAPPSYVR